jgi:hypothetical protein
MIIARTTLSTDPSRLGAMTRGTVNTGLASVWGLGRRARAWFRLKPKTPWCRPAPRTSLGAWAQDLSPPLWSGCTPVGVDSDLPQQARCVGDSARRCSAPSRGVNYQPIELLPAGLEEADQATMVVPGYGLSVISWLDAAELAYVGSGVALQPFDDNEVRRWCLDGKSADHFRVPGRILTQPIARSHT